MIPPVSGSDSRSSLFEDLPDTEETVNDELTGEKMAVEPLDIDIQNAFEVMKNKNTGETDQIFYPRESFCNVILFSMKKHLLSTLKESKTKRKTIQKCNS